jgi:hypothetical protein
MRIGRLVNPMLTLPDLGAVSYAAGDSGFGSIIYSGATKQ